MIGGHADWTGAAHFTGSGSAVAAHERFRLVADLALTNASDLIAHAGGRLSVPAALAALYRAEGTAFLARLHGGFALALWDERDERLLLAVDRVGIKRLYYADEAGRTAFASRAAGVRRPAGIAPTPDPEAVWNYLNFGFVPGPRSAFEGVSRLEPGSFLTREAHRRSAKSYWDLAYRERGTRAGDAARALATVTEDAVRRALGDGIGVGTFLSGGTDSSTVLGLAARITGRRLPAFSIGFAEERYDELHYARIAARHFGAEHVTSVVGPDAALAALPALIDACDEPFGNNSMVGTYLCARLAREQGVGRLLAGDGGDELFGGNERYRADRIFALWHLVPGLVRHAALEPLLRALPDGRDGVIGRAQRYVRRANIPNPRRFFSYQFLFAQEAARLAGDRVRGRVDAEAPWRIVERHWQRADGGAELNRLLYLDMKLAIADNDLFKVTRAVELAGVDVRFPLLDPALIDLAAALPVRFKVRGLDKRWLFKRAFRSLLPAEILAKPKHGFGVPTSDWLRRHPGFRALAHDVLGSGRARQRGWLAAGAIDELLRRHTEDPTAYYGDVLWTVLMLELWQCRHVDQAAAAAPDGDGR